MDHMVVVVVEDEEEEEEEEEEELWRGGVAGSILSLSLLSDCAVDAPKCNI